MSNRRWQDWITLLLGIWLFLSPWIVGYYLTNSVAAWNGWILGVAIVVFSAIALSIAQVWPKVVNIILGIWMIISPWVLAFATNRNAETNDVIVGILVIIFAATAMATARRHAPLSSHTAP